jgi:hypothetical protein
MQRFRGAVPAAWLLFVGAMIGLLGLVVAAGWLGHRLADATGIASWLTTLPAFLVIPLVAVPVLPRLLPRLKR